MRSVTTSILRLSNHLRPRIGSVPDYRKCLSQLAVLGVLVLLTGCAKSGSIRQITPSDQSGNELRADMISDLLSVLPQILEPRNTIIQLSDTESGKAEEAVPKLVELGYGLQRVDADQGSHFFYLADLPVNDDKNSGEALLRVSIGNIELARAYRTIRKDAIADESANLVWRSGRAIVPAGPLNVAGTRQTLELTGINVELAANKTDQSNSFTPGSVQFASMAPIEGGIPTISLITEDLVSKVVDTVTAGTSVASISANREFGNVYGDTSAFVSMLDDYNRIVREFVIFPNDSQVLGKTGKLLVKKLAGRFSENSDIIGITGCSNGPTSLDIGNEGLALGRAKRIAEELYSAGIAQDKVFDEGCWSPTTDAPGFPNRGVVIDLWRRAG